jgi:hypothetical protein
MILSAIPLLFDLIAYHGGFTLADWTTVRLTCKSAAGAGRGMQATINAAIWSLRPTLQKMLGPVYDDLIALNTSVEGALGHSIYLVAVEDTAVIIHTATVDRSVVDVLISYSFSSSVCRGAYAQSDDTKIYVWRNRGGRMLLDIVVWTEDIKKWMSRQRASYFGSITDRSFMYISDCPAKTHRDTHYYFTGKYIGVFAGDDDIN